MKKRFEWRVVATYPGGDHRLVGEISSPRPRRNPRDWVRDIRRDARECGYEWAAYPLEVEYLGVHVG